MSWLTLILVLLSGGVPSAEAAPPPERAIFADEYQSHAFDDAILRTLGYQPSRRHSDGTRSP